MPAFLSLPSWKPLSNPMHTVPDARMKGPRYGITYEFYKDKRRTLIRRRDSTALINFFIHTNRVKLRCVHLGLLPPVLRNIRPARIREVWHKHDRSCSHYWLVQTCFCLSAARHKFMVLVIALSPDCCEAVHMLAVTCKRTNEYIQLIWLLTIS